MPTSYMEDPPKNSFRPHTTHHARPNSLRLSSRQPVWCQFGTKVGWQTRSSTPPPSTAQSAKKFIAAALSLFAHTPIPPLCVRYIEVFE